MNLYMLNTFIKHAFKGGHHFFYSFLSFFFLFSFSSCNKKIEEKVDEISTERNSVATSPAVRPNVILIIANDFGYDLPGFNGGQSHSTPELDNLAANGMFFKQAYNHPDGSPSRIALLTGKYNFRNYVVWGVLPEGEQTIGNLFQNAGYKCCWVGKWQMSGADERIKDAGFNDYLVFLPKGHGQREHRYKDPRLYQNGKYLPDTTTEGKYSEDLCFDYLSNFIEVNKSTNFFGVWATLLPASPWVPVPDDPAFASWNADLDQKLDDKKYYPGMVTYLDKIVGKIRVKLEEEGIADNTIIMFCSATQTDGRLTNVWRGQTVAGGKTLTVKRGTNGPLLVYWPARIARSSASSTLIDLTDLVPTMADIARVPIPTTWGTLDGKSFYDNMLGTSGNDRDWVFCHWDNNPFDGNIVPPERFINDTTYKLYDTVGNGSGRFYNISIDPEEINPLPQNTLTQAQKKRKKQFRNILDTMHK